MAIFAGGAHASIVKMACPECGEVQARGRMPSDYQYDCRNCRHRFTLEEGLKALAGPDEPPPAQGG